MQQQRENLLIALRANKISGLEFCASYTDIMDDFVRSLAAPILARGDIAIIASGGYGRRELCPASDIDILFLTAKKASKALHADIEAFLYKIWDTDIKIGHAVRTIDECLNVTKEEAKTLTALLDARLIAGDKALSETLTAELYKKRKPKTQKSYTSAKLEERDARHKRLGDSRYVLEPNIKEGKGSLRDYQTLFWISDMMYDAKTPAALKSLKILNKKEQKRFEKAHDFLLTVRCQLHDIAGRGEERLHFDIQPALAQRLGYQHRNNAKAVERFMKHYFLMTRDIGDLTRIIIAAIETEEEDKARRIKPANTAQDGFETINGRLNFRTDQTLKDSPINILRFFRIAQTSGSDIHPKALRKINRNLKLIDRNLCHNAEANAIFLDILCDPNNSAATLRKMNESGVLERFIPEFGRVIALMQFDRYHVYTVDEHILNAIDTLHKIEEGALKEHTPLASALIHDINNRRALYVAVLLHDICKGREGKKKGQDHSTLGAELALKLCPRLGLSDQETRLVSWLVFEHLFMSDIAFKRDLSDPKTIEDCIRRIHDHERLKLLTILTTTDIIAVGPDRWNAWKDNLLTDLYTRIDARFSGESQSSEGIELPDNWSAGETHIDITQDIEKSATIIAIYTQDRNGLFATLSGGLAASGANIIEARIETLSGDIIADIFTVQNTSGKPITKAHRHNAIKSNIFKALDNNLETQFLIQKNTLKTSRKDMIFDVENKVTINNKASEQHTLIEIETRDRHALLYDLAQAFSAHRISIASAKITTLGLKAIDVFYVTNHKNEKLMCNHETKELESALTAAITDG